MKLQPASWPLASRSAANMSVSPAPHDVVDPLSISPPLESLVAKRDSVPVPPYAFCQIGVPEPSVLMIHELVPPPPNEVVEPSSRKPPVESGRADRFSFPVPPYVLDEVTLRLESRKSSQPSVPPAPEELVEPESRYPPVTTWGRNATSWPVPPIASCLTRL